MLLRIHLNIQHVFMDFHFMDSTLTQHKLSLVMETLQPSPQGQHDGLDIFVTHVSIQRHWQLSSLPCFISHNNLLSLCTSPRAELFVFIVTSHHLITQDSL